MSHRQPPSRGPSPNPIHLLYYANAEARKLDTPVTVHWSILSHVFSVRPVPRGLSYRGFTVVLM